MSRLLSLFLTSILLISDLDLYNLNVRRSYYPHPLLGRLFENKLTLGFSKVQDRLFRIIDINRYLFSGHPRENP